MKAREFTINVPINIKINNDGDPEIDVSNNNDVMSEPVMMTPQDQELELKKAELGKSSKYITQLLSEPDDPRGTDYM